MQPRTVEQAPQSAGPHRPPIRTDCACADRIPTASFAGTDTAGNVLATEADSNPSGVAGDLYWAGQSLNLDDASIGRDIIAAGDSLSIRDCTVGGAIRLAARTIDISKTAIDGSVTVAGQHVVLNTGSTANCFYAMGDTVALRGSPSRQHLQAIR